jgi:diguanylate cyclase (GGDEF)-like protein
VWKEVMEFKRNRPTIGILPGYSVLEGKTPDHYRWSVLKGIQSAARAKECNLLIAWGLGRAMESDEIHPAWPTVSSDTDFVPIGPWNADGLIVFAPLQHAARSQYLDELRKQGVPILMIATGEQGPSISADNVTGIRQAVEHLVSVHGHRHIAFIAGHPDDKGDSETRLQAFRAAAIDYGLDIDPRLIAEGLHSAPGGYVAAQRILKSSAKFTALIASNDTSAIGAIRAIRETTLRIPRDLAVIGFDDQPSALAQVPSLASIHVPLLEMGQQAVIMMVDHLRGRHELESIQIPTRLIPRQSCGCLPQIVSSAADEKPRSPKADKRSRLHGQDVRTIPQHIVEEMMAALPHLLRFPFGERTYRFCTSLVEAFHTSLKEGSPDTFQKNLLAFLQETELSDENIDVWQNSISVLRREMLKLPVTWRKAETKRLAEDMLHLARSAISESAQRQVYRHQYHKQIADQMLGEFTSRLSAILDERQVVEILEDNLGEIGIKHTRVALFEPDKDDPVAWSVILNPHLEPVTQRFPSRGFPPPGLYPADELLNVIILPLVFQQESLGYIAFDAGNLEPCATIARQLASTLKTSRLHAQVIELSLKDALTSIHNRRYFDLFLNNEVKRSVRLGNGLAIILLDIDHFKKYNDTFGHQAGDKVIQNVARCIIEGRRTTDVAARIGGEEFALILPETQAEGAQIVAEKIQEVMRTSPDFEHPITVSIGISALSGVDVDAKTLVKEADLALYEAKQTGRNRICVFERLINEKKTE